MTTILFSSPLPHSSSWDLPERRLESGFPPAELGNKDEEEVSIKAWSSWGFLKG